MVIRAAATEPSSTSATMNITGMRTSVSTIRVRFEGLRGNIVYAKTPANEDRRAVY